MPRRSLAVLPAVLLGLAAVLTLGACAGQPGSGPQGQQAEVAELRARVERLERESAEERAQLAEDIRAMRDDMATLRSALDGVTRELNTLPGAPDSGNATGHSGASKSPRQALKDSLSGFVESSKQTIDRLTKELEHSLSRPRRQEKAPETPPKEGSQI